MKQEIWYEDQPVLVNDLSLAQSSKEDAIRERLLDTYNPGVLKSSQLAGESDALLIQQGPTPGLFITVNTGIAYSPLGERIAIQSVLPYAVNGPITTTDNGIGGTTLTPQSTGSQNISVFNNATNSVWLGYLKTIDPTIFTLSEDTNERLFVKADDGFSIVVTTGSSNPDPNVYVLLGEVVTAAGAITSINTANTIDPQVQISTIPPTPFQITLTMPPNFPAGIDKLTATPTISGYTYTSGTPAAGQFTVDFINGILTFNATNSGSSVTINYVAQHTRRQYATTTPNKVAGQISFVRKPSTYAIASTPTFDDHINAKGNGVITPSNPHGLLPSDIGALSTVTISEISSSGLILPGGNAGTVVSGLYPAAVSAFALLDNKVTIAPLVTGEALNINGTIVLPTDISTLMTFTFQDPITGFPLPSGTFTFYVDPVTKTIKTSTSGTPAGTYPIASVVWNGSSLVLPLTDLRVFGTTAGNNIRLEALLGLADGLATDNRLNKVFHARLTGSVSVTGPSYSYTGLGGQVLNLTVNGNPATVLFPAVPANPPIDIVVSTINSQVGSVDFLAQETPTNSIKMLSTISLVITGGTAAPILGFPIFPAVGSADSGNIKESQISGSSSSVGTKPAAISFSYDISNNLIQFAGAVGNRLLTTTITYNSDGTVNSITEALA